MIALIIGTVLAVGALAFVLYPIFFGVKRHVPQATVAPANEGESAVAALREIEFDRATGKLGVVLAGVFTERDKIVHQLSAGWLGDPWLVPLHDA